MSDINIFILGYPPGEAEIDYLLIILLILNNNLINATFFLNELIRPRLRFYFLGRNCYLRRGNEVLDGSKVNTPMNLSYHFCSTLSLNILCEELHSILSLLTSWFININLCVHTYTHTKITSNMYFVMSSQDWKVRYCISFLTWCSKNKWNLRGVLLCILFHKLE